MKIVKIVKNVTLNILKIIKGVVLKFNKTYDKIEIYREDMVLLNGKFRK